MYKLQKKIQLSNTLRVAGKPKPLRLSSDNLEPPPPDEGDSESLEATNYEIKQAFDVRYEYSVHFTRGVFDKKNLLLRNCIQRQQNNPSRVLFVVDSGVHQTNPNLVASIQAYAKKHRDKLISVDKPWVVTGGEASKNSQDIPETLYKLSQQKNICRHSYVVAIGGGAVIDAVGYAAATAHRGIKLIRMPTTVLGQNDAGVGVKNAVNWGGRKNFVGTFVPPYAVINDFSLLDNLPEREKIAGIAEAVKVALISDRTFFNFLYRNRVHLSKLQSHVFEKMIIRCAELHLQHIRESGDPFERGSARPLDFGHWVAHCLEQMTDGELRHGEAVAIGIALDTLYSNKIGLLQMSDARTVVNTLNDIGLPTYHPALAKLNIKAALEEFREHLGGELCITLLKAIGQRVELNTINTGIMSDCARHLRSLN